MEAVAGLAHLKASARAKLFGDALPTNSIGRYEIVRQLGAGGMGAVYEALDPRLQRRAAVKVLHAADNPELVRRLIREARAMARLSHPNIVHVYEVGDFEGQTFIAMELVDGVTLRRWVELQERSWQEVVQAYIAAGRGLSAAHRAGIVHRDFKPDNVMVDGEGRPRVLDFGLAFAERAVTSDALSMDSALDVRTRMGAIMGTPAYMAAEQFAGAPTDARTDQFAFAVALFEALTGERRFAGRTLLELAANVKSGELARNDRIGQLPVAVMAALRTALRPDPGSRHRSLEDLLEILQGALQPKRPPRRAVWLVGVAAVGALAAGARVWLVPPESFDVETMNEAPVPTWVESSNLPELLPKAHPDDAFGVTIHRLSNGLTIYIAPRHDLPRVQIRTVVRAGFADEPWADSGIARLTAAALQHGTDELGTLDAERERPLLEREAELIEAYTNAEDERRAELAVELQALAERASTWSRPQEIAELYHEFGIEFDFEVTADATIFSANVPSNRIGTWAEIEAQRLARPAFRGFTTVAARLLDDARSAEFDPVRAARAAMYGGTARGGSSFGDEASIGSLPLAAVRRFHDVWYRPNNAALVLVGDIDPSSTLPRLERAFGGWQPAELPESAPVSPQLVSEPVVVETDGPAALVVALPNVAAWLPSEAEVLFHALLLRANEHVFVEREVDKESDIVSTMWGPVDEHDAVLPRVRDWLVELSEYPLEHAQVADAWFEVSDELSRDLAEPQRAAARIAGTEGAWATIRLLGPSHLGPQAFAELERTLAAPVERSRFDAAKAVVEERLRGDWLVGAKIPETVAEWYEEGHLEDPRAATWRDLGMLRVEELEALLGELRKQPDQLSVVGDRRVLERERKTSSVKWR